MEVLYHPVQSYFCTLTYNPDYLPKPEIINKEGKPCGSLDKKAVLQWLKNIQKETPVGRFRYYIVGEYGERSSRAHYHMAVFPEHPSQVIAIGERWQKRGFFSYSAITPERAAYLANYTTKKTGDFTGPMEGAEPLFRSSSRNPPLGSQMVEALISYYKQPKANAIIQKQGDIPRSFRAFGKIYPLGSWTLTKIREGLNIPVLHRDRIIANPNYLQYHETEEAEWDPKKASAIEVNLNAQTQRKIWNTPHLKL